MAEPIVLGIDPDTKTTGWALASTNEIFAVGIIRDKNMLRASAVFLETAFSKLHGFRSVDLAVVEGQKIYHASKARPNDILKLGQVAGGILGQLIALRPGIKTCFPEPREWKKDVPKAIHQARIYAHYGLQSSRASSYSYPSGCAIMARITGAGKLSKADWKHVGDAVGLALYGVKLLKAGP